MKEATEAPKVSFYDYIVIGGGTTGIPLATTLSTSYSVLLLKRGGSPYGNPNITQVMNFGSVRHINIHICPVLYVFKYICI
ncbi:putative (R)-mandelonitrile lyase [Helianthus annuus]|nr:putative (R)-mandelonitrile lyase [Helianthus annuus]